MPAASRTADAAPHLPLLTLRLVTTTALVAALTVTYGIVITQVVLEHSSPAGIPEVCISACAGDGLWYLLNNLPFAYPTILLLIPTAYWLALPRLPDASLKETVVVATLLAALIGAAAQGIITAIDLAVWPHYEYTYTISGELVAIPMQGAEKVAIVVSELVTLPLFNLVFDRPRGSARGCLRLAGRPLGPSLGHSPDRDG